MPYKPTKKQVLKARAVMNRAQAGKKKSKTLKLARTYVSRTRSKVNNMIYKTLRKFNESKINPVKRVDQQGPLPIQLANKAYWAGFVLGENIPTPWSGPWTTLKGIATIQGDLATQRTGNYIYLNKTHVTFQINMVGNQEDSTLHEFRMIVFKTRRSTNPVGRSPDPSESLFLDEIGNPFGHATTGGFGNPAEYPVDLMVQPLNKRQFVIFQDRRFVMSPQQTIPTGTETASGFNSKYISYKRVPINLNHKIKCRVPQPDTPGTLSEPSNYDFSYGIVIYARPIDRNVDAGDWDVNVRGTTTFMDP